MLSKIATKDLVNMDVGFGDGGVKPMIHMADRNKLLHTTSGNFLNNFHSVQPELKHHCEIFGSEGRSETQHNVATHWRCCVWTLTLI